MPDHLKLELQEIVSHSTMMLGTEFMSSARTVYKLTSRDISPVPVVFSPCST